MITASRKIGFDAAHRVMGHEGKCRFIHGHRYTAVLYAQADELDNLGRVVDFSVLKERVGGWIDEYWDHGAIFNNHDMPAKRAVMAFMRENQQKVYYIDGNPTAENMADYLLRWVCPLVLKGTGVKVVKVKLWETPNCFATTELSREELLDE
jgi:6-pyruvoyltetrahydropterin/6-carboxytetrahydropterin synthase